MSKKEVVNIEYAPNTFQVVKNPDNEIQDLYIVSNPSGAGGRVKAIVLETEMNETFKYKFLEFLN